MNYLNELNAYDKFCKTYFEKSESISFLKEKTKIIRVFQMLELFNIIYDYFYNSKTVVCELALICKGIVLQTRSLLQLVQDNFQKSYLI